MSDVKVHAIVGKQSSSVSVDDVSISTIRCLSADIVQKANSGHPGMPIAMAPTAHILWSKIMKFSPKNPSWANRDRFVLSNGHGCALLYSMLHLTGYAVTIQDLKQFRQLNSITPGHPESHMTPGVEVTTGPLGQGISNAVGLAIASAHLGALFNKPGFTLIDNKVYVFCGDGCLQEGISHEAASLAGHLGLENLIVVYDDNKITIDGSTDLSFSEDVPKRFESYGWNTITVSDGNTDVKSIEAALREAQQSKNKPTLIRLKTIIAFSAKNQGHHDAHGTPLGKEGIAYIKTQHGFDPNQSFFIPEKVSEFYTSVGKRGAETEAKWNEMFVQYQTKYPKEAAEFTRRMSGQLPANWENALPLFKPTDKKDATRNISGNVLNALADVIPELVGGSADLTTSNKTQLKKSKDFTRTQRDARYLRFGVREHGMIAIGNGLRAAGGIIPFTATFLNFIEYGFPAVRLCALSGFQHILIMTHDSIGLGEDGPTHQPIEALALCRATPNVTTFRPADGNETSGAYYCALRNNKGPSVLALTRQNITHYSKSSIANVAKGGYVLQEGKQANKLDCILVGTGSEVEGCMEAANSLENLSVRVVSMPCCELFDAQTVEYRRSVLIPGVPVISVEAGSVQGWNKYSHFQIGMKTFGASAPYEQLMEKFGFTGPKIAKSVVSFLKTLNDQSAEMKMPSAYPLATHYKA